MPQIPMQMHVNGIKVFDERQSIDNFTLSLKAAYIVILQTTVITVPTSTMGRLRNGLGCINVTSSYVSVWSSRSGTRQHKYIITEYISIHGNTMETDHNDDNDEVIMIRL